LMGNNHKEFEERIHLRALIVILGRFLDGDEGEGENFALIRQEDLIGNRRKRIFDFHVDTHFVHILGTIHILHTFTARY